MNNKHLIVPVVPIITSENECYSDHVECIAIPNVGQGRFYDYLLKSNDYFPLLIFKENGGLSIFDENGVFQNL